MLIDRAVTQKKVDICYYCGQPIMGLRFKLEASNNGESLCFRCKNKLSKR